MSTTRKTITVIDQQNNWIKAEIAAGEFTNDSEYIRDLIRRDQTSQADIEAMRAALIEGEQSGEPQPFDGDLFKQEMKAKMPEYRLAPKARRRGQLAKMYAPDTENTPLFAMSFITEKLVTGLRLWGNWKGRKV